MVLPVVSALLLLVGKVTVDLVDPILVPLVGKVVGDPNDPDVVFFVCKVVGDLVSPASVVLEGEVEDEANVDNIVVSPLVSFVRSGLGRVFRDAEEVFKLEPLSLASVSK